MRKIIFVLLIIIIIGVPLYITKNQFWKKDCNWKPIQKNYGLCEMILPGIYYNGDKCIGIGSGCSLQKDVPPFNSLLMCKLACEL